MWHKHFLSNNILGQSPIVKGVLRSAKIKSRRETLYKMLSKKHGGVVPCFVCGHPVQHKDATLEHILERRNGGGDEMSNLSISHGICNKNRQRIESKRKLNKNSVSNFEKIS